MRVDLTLKTPVSESLCQLFVEQLQIVENRRVDLIGLIEQESTDFSPKSIHEIRVAARRCQSVAMALDPYLPPGLTKQMKSDMQSMRKSFNNLRDLDVLLEWITSDAAAHLATAGLIDALRAVRQQAAKKQAKTLIKMTNRSDLSGLAACFDQASPIERTNGQSYLLEDILFAVLLAQAAEVTSYRAAMAARDRVVWEKSLHKLRIAGKNFRYTLEFFDPVMPSGAQPLLNRFRLLQDNLGGMHDCLRFAGILDKIFRRQKLPSGLLLELQCELGKRKNAFWKAFQSDWQEMTPQWFAENIMKSYKDKGAKTK